jgi:hypothetical protein
MNKKDQLAFKKRLMDHCVAMLKERISISQATVMEAQAAANNEEKSSAGDKYETGRAMSHINKDMHARQLAANSQELLALSQIDINIAYTIASPGALVACSDNNWFFISAGLGKVEVEGMTVYLVAPAAPVARTLSALRTGDKILFNKCALTITSII